MKKRCEEFHCLIVIVKANHLFIPVQFVCDFQVFYELQVPYKHINAIALTYSHVTSQHREPKRH